MTLRRAFKPLLLGLSLPLLLLADRSANAPLGLTLVRDAAAIVGAPMTPLSVAGVARRTTARVVAVETAAVAGTAAAASAQQQASVAKQQQAVAQQQAAVAQQQAATAQQQAAIAQAQAGRPAIGTVVPGLPAGCSPSPKGGVEYYDCGGVFYRSAFQGNSLVYVVVQQP
jgi:hypothetical protein